MKHDHWYNLPEVVSVQYFCAVVRVMVIFEMITPVCVYNYGYVYKHMNFVIHTLDI